jgi:hypothetical protein
MLRIWVVRSSPAVGKLKRRTKPVERWHRCIRDVIEQTIATTALSVNAAGETIGYGGSSCLDSFREEQSKVGSRLMVSTFPASNSNRVLAVVL